MHPGSAKLTSKADLLHRKMFPSEPGIGENALDGRHIHTQNEYFPFFMRRWREARKSRAAFVSRAQAFNALFALLVTHLKKMTRSNIFQPTFEWHRQNGQSKIYFCENWISRASIHSGARHVHAVDTHGIAEYSYWHILQVHFPAFTAFSITDAGWAGLFVPFILVPEWQMHLKRLKCINKMNTNRRKKKMWSG